MDSQRSRLTISILQDYVTRLQTTTAKRQILPVNLKVEEPIRDQLLNNNQSRPAIFALDSEF